MLGLQFCQCNVLSCTLLLTNIGTSTPSQKVERIYRNIACQRLVLEDIGRRRTKLPKHIGPPHVSTQLSHLLSGIVTSRSNPFVLLPRLWSLWWTSPSCGACLVRSFWCILSFFVCNKEIVKVTIDTIRRGVVGGTYHPQLVWAILAQEPVGFDLFRSWPIWLGGERPPGIRYQALRWETIWASGHSSPVCS